MTGEEFKGLNIDERVTYLNERMAAGESLNAIFKGLGISKSQTDTIKKNGYILIDGQYIKTNLEAQEQLKATKSINTLPKEESTPKNLKTENKAIEKSYIEKLLQDKKETVKKLSAGRPEKAGRRKATIYMEDIPFKQLQQWALWNNCSASDVLNALLKDFLKDKAK